MPIDTLPGPGKHSLHETIDLLFQMATGERCAFAVCWMLPDDDTCHWMTNISREDGVKLFEETALRMRAQTG